MASSPSEWPPNWRHPGRLPLNTNPANPSSGAYYKVLFLMPQGNPRSITADENSTGQAYFAVPWSDHRQFEIDAPGYSTYGSSTAANLKRFAPLAHGDPAVTNGSYLYLRRLSTLTPTNITNKFHLAMDTTEGFFTNKWPKTQMVAYRGEFAQLPFRAYSDLAVTTGADGAAQPEGVTMGVPELLRYITKFPETESFHRKIPGYGFAFDSSVTNYCSSLASLPEFHQRWIYTTYQWPWGPSSLQNAVPLGVMARTLGCVNDYTFDTTIRLTNNAGTEILGFPAEELKYENHVISKPYYGTDGEIFVDIQHIFLWNPFNWNKQVNPANDPSASDRGYEYVKQVNAAGAFYSPARRPFLQKDFNKLFKPRGAT